MHGGWYCVQQLQQPFQAFPVVVQGCTQLRRWPRALAQASNRFLNFGQYVYTDNEMILTCSSTSDDCDKSFDAKERACI
jgi:hypothetical protein